MSISVRIPFADLVSQNRECAEDVRACFEEILASGRFIGGPEVESLERKFAAFVGVPHVVGVSSGTAALFLALRALGVGPGDEVITAANSFVASAEAIAWTGATTVLADVDPETLQIDPSSVAERITGRTRALLPVHLYGHVADMEPLLTLARERDLAVVEDACQAHGAARGSIRAGAFGDAAGFSFYPAKNLGAPGDGGAISVADHEIAADIRALADHGRDPGAKYHHRLPGYNLRMNALPAAFLHRHLDRLASRNSARRAAAALYDERLTEIDGVAPVRPPAGSESVYHLYVIRSAERDELAAHLKENGVASGIHYPIPIHLTEAFSHLGHGEGDYPVAEQAAREVLSLPMHPGLEEGAIEIVTGAIRDFRG